MPVYKFFCPKCQKEFTIPMMAKERDHSEAKCPVCGKKDLKQLMSSFMPKIYGKAEPDGALRRPA